MRTTRAEIINCASSQRVRCDGSESIYKARGSLSRRVERGQTPSLSWGRGKSVHDIAQGLLALSDPRRAVFDPRNGMKRLLVPFACIAAVSFDVGAVDTTQAQLRLLRTTRPESWRLSMTRKVATSCGVSTKRARRALLHSRPSEAFGRKPMLTAPKLSIHRRSAEASVSDNLQRDGSG